jgi:4-hydroxy-tetrahydrodipicolinate synthase
MLTGSLVALVTPMHDDGTLDFASLERLIDWHLEEGSDAIGIVGTTGEASTVDLAEHCDLIGAAGRCGSGRAPVFAGTGAAPYRKRFTGGLVPRESA